MTEYNVMEWERWDVRVEQYVHHARDMLHYASLCESRLAILHICIYIYIYIEREREIDR